MGARKEPIAVDLSIAYSGKDLLAEAFSCLPTVFLGREAMVYVCSFPVQKVSVDLETHSQQHGCGNWRRGNGGGGDGDDD